MEKTGLAVCIAVVACNAWADYPTVSDAAGLVEALEEHNSASGSTTIYLEPGNYDVSAYAMIQWSRTKKESSSVSHIALGHVKLVGKGSNPRDTVIYGNGANRIVYASCSTIENLTISNGWTGASNKGAGVACEDASNDANKSVLSNVVITCCTSSSSGGGVYLGIYRNCEMSYNTAAEDGGGARGYQNGTRLYDCRIFGNSAGVSGGGVGSGCSAFGCVVSNNVAATYGGGTYDVVATDCRIAFNKLSGIGTYAYGAGTYSGVFTNCVISGNAVVDCAAAKNNRRGGGCYGSTLVNCVVTDNFLHGSDRGVGIDSGSACGCVISNNASSLTTYQVVRGTTFLEGCDISGTLSNPHRVVNCRLTGLAGNVEIAEGANVYTNGTFKGAQDLCSGEMFATNCLFAGNVLSQSLFRPSTANGMSIVNCTIANNDAQYTFLDTAASPAEVVNCIFAGNTYKNALRNMWYKDSDTNITLRNCMVGSGRQSAPVLLEESTVTGDNPMFVGDGSRDNYALERRSPARTKGLVQGWMANATDIRGDGYPRLRDGLVDIGCYQCWLAIPGFTLIVR